MASKRPAIMTTPGTAVAVGFALVVFSWVMAAALASHFERLSFPEQLLHPPIGEVVLRLLFISIQVVFILYIADVLQKYRQQGVLLQESLQDAETEKARSQEILEAVGDAISMQDTDFRILYQNQAHKELIGDHVGEYCHQAYQQKEKVCPKCHLAQSFQDGKSHRTEACAQTRHGIRHTEIISTPLRDRTGRVVAGIEAVRDITDSKEAQNEIQRINAELAQHAEDLAEANRELEAFSYSLSHDLRSYITRVSMAQQILAARPSGDDPEARFLISTIEEACRGMEDLIDSMLTLARLSTQEMRREEVSLTELAREIFLLLRQQELARQVDFTAAQGVTVHGDPQLLKVVLENLLGNAWKYTKGEAVARIEFGVQESEGKRCYFVRDNGIGFDMAEKDKLFHPFQRLNGAEKFPGTGVGLATVQRALKRHGGDVWAESEPGKGATFYFTLGQ